MNSDNLNLVVITGMSGAGKTVAMQSFEDMGYFCVDNMPPSLLPKFWELIKDSGKITKICLVIDLRSRDFFDELVTVIQNMDNTNMIKMSVVYLEASDSELVSRYKETRRSHPLQQSGGSVLTGIQKERAHLQDIRQKAHLIIDTSTISPRELREELTREFKQDDDHGFFVEVLSFGFKYGIPIDCDVVMDVRFLPNPHYISDLRPLTGLDKPVYDYVMAQEDTEKFYAKFTNLIDFTLPLYQKEGKSSVTIGIGCTGGQHRSIALAERIGKHISSMGYKTNISHRDRFKKKEAVNRS
ncbi:RNase adapter RapZ [Aerococcus kribbianus]|uniref:RNase adapter RapZ n=1 Tax=Aerococcus kribbianus TaxID=2999064 RepID=A0A9X3FQ28_9LACT|nr:MULTISPECIES: RNase adapter RapZ [unclassified Aerococcus]MCZ0717481.1 RNase adapter RapZ [Aerococcus sp. YH-aer221]MCZ0725769.1 RNase adapter RapZ [Aerococcus sp. YH-aer222]